MALLFWAFEAIKKDLSKVSEKLLSDKLNYTDYEFFYSKIDNIINTLTNTEENFLKTNH